MSEIGISRDSGTERAPEVDRSRVSPERPDAKASQNEGKPDRSGVTEGQQQSLHADKAKQQERDRFSSDPIRDGKRDSIPADRADTQQKSHAAVQETRKQGQERDRFSTSTVERGKVDRFRPGGNDTNTHRPENQNAQKQRETQSPGSETTKVNENKQSENANREVVKAETIPEKSEVIPLSSMPAEQKEKMNELFRERDKAQSEKARLEPQGQSQDLTKARYEMTDASRKLGEQAADYYGKETRKAEKVYPDREGSRSGDFDRVYKTTGADGKERYIVIEAKGGNSALGERTTQDGFRAQQGSREYFQSIADNMADSSDAKIAKIGSSLQDAIVERNVEYVKVHATLIQRDKRETLGDIHITHFKL